MTWAWAAVRLICSELLGSGYHLREARLLVYDLTGALPTSHSDPREAGSVTAISPDLPGAGRLPGKTHSFADLNLSALAITETELKLMAAAAIIGFRSRPNIG
jgi:hypothetical protein